jgi:catechol 2,3-dioxygenase-like lactoylglutathione lyase family enzyme
MAVRYIVNDVDAAIRFYTRLGFTVEQQFGSAMAILAGRDMKLWLAGPQSSAAQAMKDGEVPTPGGWNRIVVECQDFDATIAELTAARVRFRNAPVTGPGGRQVLCFDPSGNLVELFSTRPK